MKTIKIAAITKDNKVFGNHNEFESLEVNLSNLMDDYTRNIFNNENGVLSSWWYLHGDLQSLIGFDKGIIVNYNELPNFIKEVEDNDKILNKLYIENGIYDVEVIGINKPCIGYFYNDNNMLRGYVCLKSDYEACEEAYQKYIKKSPWL